MSSRFSSSSEVNASELLENLEDMFICGTTWTVILSLGSNLQPHTSVVPVSKEWIIDISISFFHGLNIRLHLWRDNVWGLFMLWKNFNWFWRMLILFWHTSFNSLIKRWMVVDKNKYNINYHYFFLITSFSGFDHLFEQILLQIILHTFFH